MNKTAEHTLYLKSESLSDTEAIGHILAKLLPSDSVVALYGDLAAGKTALARALFEEKGFIDHFSSPTFTIINQYENGGQKAFHMDVYRIEDSSELPYAGYDDCMEEGCFTVIEWADLIEDALPADALRISLKQGEISDCRQIEIHANDDVLLHTVKEALHAYLVD